MADTKDATSAEIPSAISFVYEQDPNYRIVAANGAWGGLTIHGDMAIDFIVDLTTVPERMEQAVVDGKALGAEVRRFPPDRTITRRRQVGVLMTTDVAESVARFIIDKLNTYRSQNGQASLSVIEERDRK